MLRMSNLRNVAAALVCCLLLVPALTRVGQPLHAARSSTPVPSFTKSVDVPPDPVVVVLDLSPKPIDTEALIQPVGRVVPAVHDVVPPLPAVTNGDALRAPPVHPTA